MSIDDVVNKTPNCLTELIEVASHDKKQDTYKITVAWLEYTKNLPVPLPEEIRQNTYNLLYHNYKEGMYKKKGGKKR